MTQPLLRATPARLRTILRNQAPALAALALLALLSRAPCAGASSDKPLLTDLHSYYEVPPAQAANPHRVRWELDVLYCDREWNLLWVEQDGFATFVAQDDYIPPLRAGQRILVEGEAIPANDLVLRGSDVRVLDEPSRTRAIETKGNPADAARLTNHMAVIEALVAAETAPDSTHLQLQAETEGLPLVVNIQIPRDGARPSFVGNTIRATGVYTTGNSATSDLPQIALWVQDPAHIEVLGTPTRPADAGTTSPANRPRTADTPTPTLPDLHSFYEGPRAATRTPHQVSWDLDILYLDREWNLLWVANNGFATFVTPGTSLPDVSAGQRIHVEGLITPGENLTLDGTRIEVLDTPSLTRPLPTANNLGDSDRFNNHLATIEAVVDRQRLSDPTHLMLEASAEGIHVAVRARIAPGSVPPDFVGRTIRATGVYVGHRNFAGDLTSVALWVQKMDAIEVVGAIEHDPLFSLPVARIEQINEQTPGDPIHIVGTVHSLDNTAATITLRDSTGQVVISTAQTRGIKVGSDLEAIGRPQRTGLQRRLLSATVRPLLAGSRHLKENADRPGEPRSLRLADEVLMLEAGEADHGRTVQLFGVATWMATDRTSMFIEDTTGGIEIKLPVMPKQPPELPCAVLVEGRTARGAFAPIVAADSVVWSNPLGSPEPRQTTLDELMTGNLHGRWIGLQAYLRAISRSPQGILLDLTTTTGELSALLPSDARLTTEPGAIVSVNGVCCVLANERHQLSGIRLLVPAGENIVTDELAPMDPFALPARSLAALREFGPAESSLHRICTIGTVVFHEPGRFLCLQDGNDSLLALSRHPAPLQPGDRVEVVGIPGREGSRLVLREAAYRRTAHVAEPEPLALAGPEIRGEGYDGRLVRLAGTVIDTHRTPTEVVFSIEADKKLFAATLPPRLFDPTRHQIGSQLALRGVYRTIFDEYRQPVGFSLALRTAGDIAVLAAPPLWTTRRALAAAACLLLVTGVVFSWVAVLRARVAKQTTQIRNQLEDQKRLETELLQAQRVESLTLLAGGIAHDFNNLLTGILVNLSLARIDTHANAPVAGTLADAELATLRARDLTQQLLVFSKGGAPCRSVVDIATVVRESANFALYGSSVRGEFKLPDGLWLADADRVQVAQVVQNLAINAVQAMPRGGHLHIAAANDHVPANTKADLQAGRYIRLTITDEGSGIPAEQLPKIFDPYFTTKKRGNGLGLATVFTIVRRHGGHIEVESEVDRGTTFRLWLPASDAAEPSANPAPAMPKNRPQVAPPVAAHRILVMDDDPIIRRSSAMALLQAGHEPTVTGDGYEALAIARCAIEQNRPFAVLLLDLTIPGGMGGKDTLDAIRQLDPSIRAIASSGHVNDPVFLESRHHGFDDVLAKPYQVAQMHEVVARVLAGARG